MIIRGAAAALPGEDGFRKVDILVRAGKIARVAERIDADPGDPDRRDVLDATGLMMFPGAIDPHVHFDEPGFTHREDFFHGTSEAARGGVTTVVDMPCTSLPPIVDAAALDNKLSIVAGRAVVDFAFFGGISGHRADESFGGAMEALAKRVVGFKCYFVSGMDTFTAVTKEQFGRAAAECDRLGRPLLLHAEDPDVIGRATARIAAGRIAAGQADRPNEWRDYYASRPMEAETAACADALGLAGKHAGALHVVHVGTAAAAKAVAAGGATCETCAHYLAFGEEDFEALGPSLKTAPPVKEARQKSLLWRLLADGTISFVASDHAGAPEVEKFTGDPLTAYGGIPGTGTLFPYLLSEGLFARRIGLARFTEATSGAAARRYGLSGGKGSLEPGKDADFVLVDPSATTLLDPAAMRSKSRITPFAGMRLAGRIIGTFLRGACVYGDPHLAARGVPDSIRSTLDPDIPSVTGAPGAGRFLTWGYR